MNKRQIKDAELCDEMTERGETKDCFSCSCSVCLSQLPDEIEPFKRHLLKKIETLKEDIPHACCSVDEMYGASEMLGAVIKIIKGDTL